MKNKTVSVLLAVFMLASAVFCGLWIREKKDQSDLERLCSSSAAQALQSLQQYGAQGHEEDYWYGVAAFHTFMRSRMMLEDGDMDSTEYSRAYGSMVLAQDKANENLDKLLAALALFAADYADLSGVLRLSEFNNAVEHGE